MLKGQATDSVVRLELDAAMFQFYLSAYPWDLMHEDLDRILDRLHGEVGVTGLSVWIGVPPKSQLRVRDVQPRVFTTRGGLFFHPDSKRYTSTRCKPIVSDWLKTRRTLERLSEACQQRGMALRAIVSASQTGRLVQRHPDMACKNAFGDESQLSLCLANPDVQTFLCSLVSDLSAYEGLTGVTIADFVISWVDAWANTIDLSVAVRGTELALLSTCFCESCQQTAGASGVDVEMARRSVRTMLQAAFDAGTSIDEDNEPGLTDDQPLADFTSWRSSVLSSLLGRLVDSCGCELLVDRRLNTMACGSHSQPDWTLPAGVITRLDVPENLEGNICRTARRNELQLDERYASRSHAPQLVHLMSQSVELGFSAIEMCHYGLLSDSAFVPIKQAIRFAKRSAGKQP